MTKTSLQALQEASSSNPRKPMIVHAMAGPIIEKIALLEETMFYRRAAYAIETAFIDFAIDTKFIPGSAPIRFPAVPDEATKSEHLEDIGNLEEFLHGLAARFSYMIENERPCHIRSQYIADFIATAATFPACEPIVRPTHTFEKQETSRYVWSMSPIHLELAGRIGWEYFNQKRSRPVVFSAVVDTMTKKLQMTSKSPYPTFTFYPRKELLRVPNSSDLFALAANDALFRVGLAAGRLGTSKTKLKGLRNLGKLLGVIMVQAQNSVFERRIDVPQLKEEIH